MRGSFVIALVALAGCDDCNPKEIGGGLGLDLTWVPLVDVGRVYECTTRDGAELELCSDLDDDDLGRELGGSCRPTSRHLGPCFYCCGPDCGRGANAFNGCYCPEDG